MNRFENKEVLVTGGNSGIGLATAKAFAKEGAHVVITGRDQKTLDEAKKSLGESAIALRNDAGDLAAAKTLAEVIAKANIKLDAIFINVGVAKFASLEDADETLWDLTFNTNSRVLMFPLYLVHMD